MLANAEGFCRGVECCWGVCPVGPISVQESRAGEGRVGKGRVGWSRVGHSQEKVSTVKVSTTLKRHGAKPCHRIFARTLQLCALAASCLAVPLGFTAAERLAEHRAVLAEQQAAVSEQQGSGAAAGAAGSAGGGGGRTMLTVGGTKRWEAGPSHVY